MKDRKITNFDAHFAEELKDPESAAVFIQTVLEDNDPTYLKVALARIVHAHGYSKIAELSGIRRESLYKMLSDNGNPSTANIQEILHACGLKFNIVPGNVSPDREYLDLDKPVPAREKPQVAATIWAYIKRNRLGEEILGQRKMMALVKETHQLTGGKKRSTSTKRKATRRSKS